MKVDGGKLVHVLNVSGTLTRFGGDQGLLLEMTAILLEDAPRLARQLQAAVLKKDATAIAAHAHALKGLVAGCGGERAAQAAELLESAGHRGTIENVAPQFAKLEEELRSLFSAIFAYRDNRVDAETAR